MATVEMNDPGEQHPDHGKDKTVTVTVDTKPKTVKAKRYVVSEFKREVGVAKDRDLDQIVNGTLTPLADTDHITIEGGEEFVSHERRGDAS